MFAIDINQIEIESLSKRCKQAENSFSNLVASLTPLPDPASLETTLAKSAEQDASVATELRKTIKELESEMSTLKNQDVTVRKLEKRLQEIQLAHKSEIDSLEATWSQRIEQVRSEGETRNTSLQEQVSMYKRDYESVLEESKSAQKNILIEKKRHEEILSSRNNELENQRRQIDQLKEEQARLHATVSSSTTSNNINLYKDIISQSEDRISRLQAEIDKARESEMSSKGAEERARKELESKTASLSSEIDTLRQSLDDVMSEMRLVAPSEPMNSIRDVTVLIRKLGDLREEVGRKDKSIQNLKTRNSELEAAVVLANNELETHRKSFTEIPLQSNEQGIEMTSHNVSGDGSNVVAIITSQRDRFRNRAVELESERDKLKQGQLDLSNKINLLMADMRRMEQERNFWRTSSQTKSGSNSDVEAGGPGKSTGSVAPPVLFSKLRKTATGNGDFEQAATSIIVYGIGNPIIRRVALGYLLTLHLLVFMVLYRLSSIVSTDSNSQ